MGWWRWGPCTTWLCLIDVCWCTTGQAQGPCKQCQLSQECPKQVLASWSPEVLEVLGPVTIPAGTASPLPVLPQLSQMVWAWASCM